VGFPLFVLVSLRVSRPSSIYDPIRLQIYRKYDGRIGGSLVLVFVYCEFYEFLLVVSFSALKVGWHVLHSMLG